MSNTAIISNKAEIVLRALYKHLTVIPYSFVGQLRGEPGPKGSNFLDLF